MSDDKKKEIIDALKRTENYNILTTNDPNVAKIFHWFCEVLKEMEENKQVHLSCYRITPEGIERFDIGSLPEKIAVAALLPYITDLFGVKTDDDIVH